MPGYSPSSLVGGRPSVEQVIVCVDVPDIDNFLMVLRVIRDHPQIHVHVVLSPRPVDFAAFHYGEERIRDFGKKYGPMNVIGRMTEDDLNSWVKDAKDDDKKWFYIDEDFRNSEILVDTRLYMRVSIIRLTKFLHQHKIDPTAYRIYYDSENLSGCPIVPGTHNALHQPDFAFDFGDMLLQEEPWETAAQEYIKATPNVGQDGDKNPTERDLARFKEMCKAASQSIHEDNGQSDYREKLSSYLFEKAVYGDPDYSDGSMRSHKRREDTRLLCKVYLHKQEKDLLYNHQETSRLEELIKTVGQTTTMSGPQTKPLLYVGGPFTEALKIIDGLTAENVGPVIAMAGTTEGKSNLFSNQFNILVDPISAEKVFKLAKERDIDLTLLPTECVKGTPLDLDFNTFTEQVRKHPGTYNHIKELYWQWSYGRNVTLFDLLAAMTVTTDLYKGTLQYVDFHVDTQGKFHFTRLPKKEVRKGPGLKMFWTTENFSDLMKKNQATLLEELRQTVEGKS
ncbi:hypothetical protein SLS62_006039 [Diatrype stigma]|uniref:Inosine/uridine-preferring nucleoside hydrolase domain-containing protein n=1 Tax=Diatrype stigma TaxID=117547 RepID=A0AAN9YN56_9PEZI